MTELLRLMANGRWHTGPQLAAALGVSRAAVWKRVRAARESGLQIDAVRGRGYRLRRSYQPLDAAAIEAGLSAAARAELDELEVLDSAVSTNTRLLAREDAGCRACFAERQTGGRGRRGRRWLSPFGANLYFSVARSFDPAPPAIGALGLAVGVALAEALHGLGADTVAIKWPNDLVADGAKLGGILIEHRGEAAGGCTVVAGVGLNVAMQPDQAEDLDQPWTTLSAVLGEPPARNLLAAAMLDAVMRALRDYATGGFEVFRRRWSRFDAVAGHEVTLDLGLETAGRRVAGRAAGVAPDGALVVDVNGRRERFYTGDVSLRVRA